MVPTPIKWEKVNLPLRPTLQVFLVPLPNAARYAAHTSWLLLTIHCAHLKKNTGSGQVRSPERICWPHLRKVYNHVRARVFFSRSGVLSAGIHNSTNMCSFYISEFVYLWPEVRSEQSSDLYITSLWENNEMRPASSKRIKTTQFLQDYDRLTDL